MAIHKNTAKYKVAQELAVMYYQMKQMAARLEEISEEYELDGLQNLLKKDIQKIEETDHSLLALAHKLAQGPSLKPKKGE